MQILHAIDPPRSGDAAALTERPLRWPAMAWGGVVLALLWGSVLCLLLAGDHRPSWHALFLTTLVLDVLWVAFYVVLGLARATGGLLPAPWIEPTGVVEDEAG